MKRLSVLILCALLSLTAAGCGASQTSNAKAAGSKTKTVSDVLADAQATTAADTAATQIATQFPQKNLTYPKLDYKAELDLSTMSSTMVYAEVSNMMQKPDDYVGKTVKANGTFDVFVDPKTETYYYTCIVQDATACCSQGIEFLPEKEMKYPDDFPEVGTPIAVGGTFETYKEGEKQYIRLKNAKLAIGKNS